jgi:hypothetical protein
MFQRSVERRLNFRSKWRIGDRTESAGTASLVYSCRGSGPRVPRFSIPGLDKTCGGTSMFFSHGPAYCTFICPDVMVVPVLLPGFIQGRIWSRKTNVVFMDLWLTQLELKLSACGCVMLAWLFRAVALKLFLKPIPTATMMPALFLFALSFCSFLLSPMYLL